MPMPLAPVEERVARPVERAHFVAVASAEPTANGRAEDRTVRLGAIHRSMPRILIDYRGAIFHM